MVRSVFSECFSSLIGLSHKKSHPRQGSPPTPRRRSMKGPLYRIIAVFFVLLVVVVLTALESRFTGRQLTDYLHHMSDYAVRSTTTVAPAAKPILTHPHLTIVCHFEEHSEPSSQMCHLQNVCWDRGKSVFVYYRDTNHPDAMDPLVTMDGGKRDIYIMRRH